MNKADKMLNDLGIKQKLIHENKVLFLTDDLGLMVAYLDLEIEEFALEISRYCYSTVSIHLALHEKMKELGWLDE